MWCNVSWKCVLNHLVKGCASVKQLWLPVQLIIIATWGHLREHNNYNRNVAEAMWEAFGNWMALDIWWMTRQVNVMEEWRWIFRRPWKISTPGFIALGMTLNSKRFWFSKLFHHSAINSNNTVKLFPFFHSWCVFCFKLVHKHAINLWTCAINGDVHEWIEYTVLLFWKY